MTLHETALKSVHESLGARLVPFAGWNMPVQYRGILEEVQLVRTRAGLFDLGHMGRVAVRGPDAVAFLQRVQTNDVTTIKPGQIRYAMFLNEQGLTQDDILVYHEPAGDGWFLVINAGNCERDLGILRAAAASFRVTVDDQTRQLAMIAIQGPRSQAVAQRVTDIDLAGLKYYSWARGRIAGVPGSLSRTGYTGEDGFEFYVPQTEAVRLWNLLLEQGRAEGLLPAGLGSRDTLRLEAGMPLYGHEIDETTNPLEAGLGWAVKFTHDFVGRAALEQIQAKGGTGRRLVGFVTPSRRVPRQGYPLIAGGREIGRVASGTSSPTLQTNLGTGYVADAFAQPGAEIAFAIKDKLEPAKVVPLPFYKRSR